MMTRRDLLLTSGSALALGSLIPAAASTQSPIRKPIPVSGELLPAVGMGTAQTFDMDDIEARGTLLEVLSVFFRNGGTLVETSPMYARAERVVGDLVWDLGEQGRLFAATNIWTDGREQGIAQMRESFRLMRVREMDLMQIHNLRSWRTHLPTLREWKEEGRIRYLGVTTSVPEQFDECAEILRDEALDFVQVPYNIAARGAEDVLLPLAAERGVAVLAGEPFGGGRLFPRVSGLRLPEWAADIDCSSWAQFFLKFVVSHPAVTCTIPATSNPMHAADNMAAGFGRLPDAAMRDRMAQTILEL